MHVRPPLMSVATSVATSQLFIGEKTKIFSVKLIHLEPLVNDHLLQLTNNHLFG